MTGKPRYRDWRVWWSAFWLTLAILHTLAINS